MQKMERLIAIDNVKCIQFRPRIPSDMYFISIVNGDGCSSYVNILFTHLIIFNIIFYFRLDKILVKLRLV